MIADVNGQTLDVYSADELSARLGLNRKSVYGAARKGEIPCRRVGRRFIFPRAAIEAWLNGASIVGSLGASASLGKGGLNGR